MKIRLVTVKLEVYSDADLDQLEPQVAVEVEEGIPALVGIAAAIGGTKSMLKALEEEYARHGGVSDDE